MDLSLFAATSKSNRLVLCIHQLADAAFCAHSDLCGIYFKVEILFSASA